MSSTATLANLIYAEEPNMPDFLFKLWIMWYRIQILEAWMDKEMEILDPSDFLPCTLKNLVRWGAASGLDRGGPIIPGAGRDEVIPDVKLTDVNKYYPAIVDMFYEVESYHINDEKHWRRLRDIKVLEWRNGGIYPSVVRTVDDLIIRWQYGDGEYRRVHGNEITLNDAIAARPLHSDIFRLADDDHYLHLLEEHGWDIPNHLLQPSGDRAELVLITLIRYLEGLYHIMQTVMEDN